MPLLDSDVPAKIFFGLQIRVVPENFVLTAGRAESRCYTRVQRRVGLVDLVTAGDPISPNAAELVKMIETPASNEDQVVDRRQRRLEKSGNLLGVIAHKGWLRPERLRNKRPLLAGIDFAVEKPTREREPRRGSQVVLIINLRSHEERSRGAEEPILIWIIHLPFVIVIEN